MSPAPAHWPNTQGIDTRPDLNGHVTPRLRRRDVSVVDVLDDLAAGADPAELCHWNQMSEADLRAVMRFCRGCVVELDRLISGREPVTRQYLDELRRQAAASKATRGGGELSAGA